VLSPIPYAFLPRDAASGWANYDNPNAVATFDGDQTIISASTANAAAEYQYPIFNTTNQYVASVRAGVKARKDGEGSCGVQLVFKSSRGSVGPDESVNLSPIFQLKGSYDVGYTEFLPWYSEYPLMPAVEYWLMEDFTTETTHGFGVKYKSI
jgi:hypothetical protein